MGFNAREVEQLGHSDIASLESMQAGFKEAHSNIVRTLTILEGIDKDMTGRLQLLARLIVCKKENQPWQHLVP